MKSIIIILAITFMLCLVTGLCYAQSVECVYFPQKHIKLGKVPPQKIECEFKLKNNTAKSINISDVIAGCGCVLTEYHKGVIRPYSSGHIKVILNAKYIYGFFCKRIKVFCSDNSIATLYVSGQVVGNSKKQ